jgi:hypothetical protein
MSVQLRGAEAAALLRKVLQYQQALGGALALQDNEPRDLARVVASAEECAVAFLEVAVQEEDGPLAQAAAVTDAQRRQQQQQQQQHAAVDWPHVL